MRNEFSKKNSQQTLDIVNEEDCTHLSIQVIVSLSFLRHFHCYHIENIHYYPEYVYLMAKLFTR